MSLNDQVIVPRFNIVARNMAIGVLLLICAVLAGGWYGASQVRDLNAAIAQVKDLEVFDLQVTGCVKDRMMRRLAAKNAALEVGYKASLPTPLSDTSDTEECHLAVTFKDLKKTS